MVYMSAAVEIESYKLKPLCHTSQNKKGNFQNLPSIMISQTS